MVYEDSIFKIYYNECDLEYIDILKNVVLERMQKIIDFFDIKFDGKIVIKFYDDLDAYKNNLEEGFRLEAILLSKNSNEEVTPRKFMDFMIANTYDGNVNMMSLFLARQSSEHKDITVENYCVNAAHEFVHLCHNQIMNDLKSKCDDPSKFEENPGWFFELIATLLGNYDYQVETDDIFTIDDLCNNFDTDNGYSRVYTLGKYIEKTRGLSYIRELIYSNDRIREEIPLIISEMNCNKKKI